ncbi:calcium permease [Fusarium sp. NRRL 52700]|nr:calcium permease [Fusarium sp. NRRL 52700]
MSSHLLPIANAINPIDRPILSDDEAETADSICVHSHLYQPRHRTTRRKSRPSDFAPSYGRSTEIHCSRLPRARLTQNSFEPVDESLSDGDQHIVPKREDRQQAINRTHPFGIRVWNPPLYHEEHSTSNGVDELTSSDDVNHWTFFFNFVWTLLFGWWLSLLALFCSIICMALLRAQPEPNYGRFLYDLAGFIFYPFGKFVEFRPCSLPVPGIQREVSLSHRGQQTGASSENDQLLCYSSLNYGHGCCSQDFFQRAQATVQEPLESIDLPGSCPFRKEWSFENTVFTLLLYIILSPALLLVAMTCWCFVFPLPTARMLVRLLRIVRSCALQISFTRRSESTPSTVEPRHTVLIHNTSFVGLSSWRQSFGGINIVLINLMAIAIVTAFDWLFILQLFHYHSMVVSPSVFFLGSLLGIIPLVYIIGQAVASVSTQSSMGTSAVVNALFSTVFEVIFYCVALKHGKSELVEGCVIGSILAGVLFLPGLSMCFGALKRKTQRFNAKSAGVTSTMLLFAIMGVFSPTIFYAIYGTYVVRRWLSFVLYDSTIGSAKFSLRQNPQTFQLPLRFSTLASVCHWVDFHFAYAFHYYLERE